MTRQAGRLGLQLWIIGFIVFFGAEVVHLEPGLRLLTHLVYGIPLVILVAARLRGPWDRLDAAVLIGVVIYLAVALAARDRTQAVNTVALVTAFAALFMLARREATGGLRSSVISAIAIGLTMTLAFNAWLLIEEKLRWFSAVGSAPLEGLTVFPWQTVNAMPVLVLIAIPFVAWLPSRSRATFAAAVAVAGVVVVPISLGRAGWLGLGVAAVGAAALTPGLRAALARRPWGPAAMVAAVGIGTAIGALLVLPAFIEALQTSGRAALWSQGIEMVGARPILGHGPGAFSWARLEFGPDSARWLAVILVHNVPLQTLIDGGVVLLLALLLPLATWLASVVRRFRTYSGPDRVAFAALVGFAVSTLLDDFSFNPSITAVVLVAGAFLVPIARRPAARRADLVPLGIVALLAALSIPQVWAVDDARSAAQMGRIAASEERWGDAAEAFRRATTRHWENGGYWLGLGLAESHVGNTEAALDAYAQAAHVSPGDARGYGGLAALDNAVGADGQLERAVELSFDDAQYAIRLAESSDGDDVVAALGRAAAISPSTLAASGIPDGMSGTPIAAVTRDFLERKPRPGPDADPAVEWDLALLFDDLPRNAPAVWRAVDAARHGELERAAALADRAVEEAPHDHRSWQAVAMTAAYRCDESRLDEALRALAVVGGGWGRPSDSGGPDPRREFVYREPGLGATQPPGVEVPLAAPWPWGLIPDPEPCP